MISVLIAAVMALVAPIATDAVNHRPGTVFHILDSKFHFEGGPSAPTREITVSNHPGINDSFTILHEIDYVGLGHLRTTIPVYRPFLAGQNVPFQPEGEFGRANITLKHFNRSLNIISNCLPKIFYLPRNFRIAANDNIFNSEFACCDIGPCAAFMRFFCNPICFPHRIGRMAGVLDSAARQDDLPEQESRTDNGDPKTPLCPKCAIFSSISRAPLGAKIAFSFPFWFIAWGFVIEGIDGQISGRRRARPFLLLVGILISGIPLFMGI